MSSKGIIIGSRNRVEAGVENIVAMNCQDETFTTEDSNKTILQNRMLEISDTGISPKILTMSGNFNTGQAGSSAGQYLLDATPGSFVVTLQGPAEYIFQKIDGTANTITLTPDTGTINGAASKVLGTQYEKITAVFDGTNWFY